MVRCALNQNMGLLPGTPAKNVHVTMILMLPDTNPPVRLLCGHAISRDAMKKLVGHSKRCTAFTIVWFIFVLKKLIVSVFNFHGDLFWVL